MIREIGIPAEGLFRLARKLGMPFLAKPPIPYGESYKGIIEFPGFHTTENFDIAAAYAAGRVSQSYTETDESGVHYVTDYPVVVALNMVGHHALPDYDAVKMVKPALLTGLGEALRDLDEEASDEEIVEAVESYTEFVETERDTHSDPMAYISEEAFSHFENVLRGIYDDPRFPDAARLFLQTGEFPDDLLLEATDQFRYEEDVKESRIVGVWYLTPVAGESVDWQDEDNEESEVDARWPGFNVYGEDDLMGGYASIGSQQVYEGEATGIEEMGPQLPLFTPEQLPPPEPVIQYHGTTYLRLLQAAPFLEGELPEPPSPPFRAGVGG